MSAESNQKQPLMIHPPSPNQMSLNENNVIIEDWYVILVSIYDTQLSMSTYHKQ